MAPTTPFGARAEDRVAGGAAPRVERRADAQRNHDEVFAAAVEIFAARGQDATIPEIAARAGVGKATVYRSYPTKADLVDAVAAEQLDWLDVRVQAASVGQDAYAALSTLLGEISGRLAEDRLFSQVLTQATQWGTERPHHGTIAEIFERAQRQGRLSLDASPQDLRVLVGGYARVLLDLEVRDPAQWRRYSALVLRALRAEQPSGS